ncbi:MAG: hypothetical protein M1825_001055 [Sarcosagium campestre]|nr:MAG: hypothetical protein M1825_001055 [Sarcosagium campestre]
MSDQAVFTQLREHNLRADAASREAVKAAEAANNIMAHKRKREATDQEGDSGRGEGSLRRSSFKRTPPAHAASHSHTRAASNSANDSIDPSGSSFLSAHNQSSGGIGGDEGVQNSSATTVEYGAASQQQGSEQGGHHNGGSEHADATSTAAAALAGIYPTMTVPQPTDLSFASTVSAAEGDASFNVGEHESGHQGGPGYDLEGREGQHHPLREQSGGQKPAVGSEEWHRVRRDNHKEVERRRRETINEGINELAKIVPGCEKNKGSILQRAVSFITQLKDNESQNIEKWTLEKLLTEQAIAELSASVDKLKSECERAWREAETWKKACQSAGIDPLEPDSAKGKEAGKRGD